MPRNVYEVLVGAATLYSAPTGTAFPADPTVAPGGSFTEIGYSQDGWRLAVDQKAEPIIVEEEMDPIQILRTTMEIHLRGVSAQGSLQNIQLALGGGTITTSATPNRSIYTPPVPTDLPVEVALLLRGKAPAVAGVAKTRDIQLPRGMSVAAIEVGYHKAPNMTVVAQDWRILRPIAGGPTFTIVDLT
jgi:hypothetical protein